MTSVLAHFSRRALASVVPGTSPIRVVGEWIRFTFLGQIGFAVLKLV
jgi:hypothetical protein